MTIKTIILPAEKAKTIQERHKDFNCCQLTEIAIASGNQAKITVCGDDDDIKALFESIGE